jgi:hypothetical protein
MEKLNCGEMIPVSFDDIISYLIYSNKDSSIDSTKKVEYGKINVSALAIRINEKYDYASTYSKEYSFEFKVERIMCKSIEIKNRYASSYTTLDHFNGYIISLNDLKSNKENKSINTDPCIKIYTDATGIVLNRFCNAKYHEMMDEKVYLNSIEYDITFSS